MISYPTIFTLKYLDRLAQADCLDPDHTAPEEHFTTCIYIPEDIIIQLIL